MLHFGNELTWECRTRTVCECSFRAAPGASKDSKVRLLEDGSLWSSNSSPSTLHLTWKCLVEDYSELTSNLTYESDIFPAMAGLANRFSRLLGDEYVAGLWRKTFIEGLLWRVPLRQEGGVPREWRAPTWSWASVCCPVKYVSISASEWTFAEVVQIDCIQAGSTLTGKLSTASLTLSGPICQARLSKVTPKEKLIKSRDSSGHLIGHWRIMWESCCKQCASQESQNHFVGCELFCTSDLYVDHLLPESLDGKLVDCMRLACYDSKDWYLVLLGTDSITDEYQRIGLTNKYSPWHRSLSDSSSGELAHLRSLEQWRTLKIT